jgi:hypothetical protein
MPTLRFPRAIQLCIPLLVAVCWLMPHSSFSQTLTQVVKGTVIDRDSRMPLEYANVVVQGTDPVLGATTDEQGNFRIEGVPVGRATLAVQYVGYESALLSEVKVTSAKEVVVTVEMTEKISEVVVIESEGEKGEARNEMAAVSTRQLSIAETNRYAGGWGDPSRMASNFAGVVSNNDQRNDIVVRGNSPVGVLWRMDGVDIPNPNHFTTNGTSGGGISMLNNNTLENSDFMTGAFPSEYGNATSAVFDLRMRKGNMDSREYLVGFGPNGIEFGAEGPFVKGKPMSYLINYRLSSMKLITKTGLLNWVGGVPNFSDLNFKFHFQLKNGYISAFGLGGGSSIEFKADRDTTQWVEPSDRINELFGSRMAVGGITYMHLFNSKTFLRTTFVSSGAQSVFREDSLSTLLNEFPDSRVSMAEGRNSVSMMLNHKASARHTFRTGIIASHLWYDMKMADYVNVPSTEEVELFGYQGGTLLAQAYGAWKYRLNEALTLNLGVHGTFLMLDHQWSAEPRASLTWQVRPRHSLALGLGRHSRMLPAGIYFGQALNPYTGSLYRPNTGLDFIRSDQAVLTYDFRIADHLRLKVEGYAQRLYAVPITGGMPTSFSGLNLGSDFDNIVSSEWLLSEGKGRNLGTELTLERFFSEGYFFLLTGSLYDSRYQGSDEVWRNTSFNGNFACNVLAGREFTLGKRKRNVLNVSTTVMYAGGRRLIPIDLEASRAAGATVLVLDQAYSEQAENYFRTDLRLAFRNNQKKFSHEIAFDLRNLFNTQNYFRRDYNPETDRIEYEPSLGLFPMVFYRFEF